MVESYLTKDSAKAQGLQQLYFLTTMNLKIILYLFSIILPVVTFSQQAISLKPSILGYHPYADLNNHIAPRRLGDGGTFALEPGIIIGYENYLFSPAMGLKTNVSFFKDNADKASLFVHLGFRYMTESDNQAIAISIGPTLFMRQSWADVPDYVPQDFWDAGESWDSKIAWLSGEVEMIYSLTPQHRINISLGHMAPQTFNFTIGYSYWLVMKKSRRGSGKRTNAYKKAKRRRRR